LALKLQKLLKSCDVTQMRGGADMDIRDIIIDSRKVLPGALFVCIPGAKADGHAFGGQAKEKGASALVVEHFLPEVDLPQALVPDAREALARLCGAFHGAETLHRGRDGHERQNDNDLHAQIDF
jgi:UDP-N-acetylmuramoyl-L-alanyl-D-glutamate--2,6-diaminopimelate ligase